MNSENKGDRLNGFTRDKWNGSSVTIKWMKHIYNNMIFSQHIVFGLTGLVALYIPDVPSRVNTQIQRENQLDREAFFEMEIQQAKEKKKAQDKVQVNIIIFFFFNQF